MPVAVLRRRGWRRTVGTPLRGLSCPTISQLRGDGSIVEGLWGFGAHCPWDTRIIATGIVRGNTVAGIAGCKELGFPPLGSVTGNYVIESPAVTVTVYECSQQVRFPRCVHVRSRLWTGFAGCKVAAEPPLERRDPFGCPERSPDRRCPLDPSRRRLVGRCCEKGSKIGDQRAQGRHRCQLVILTREMGAGARPWPVLGTGTSPRPMSAVSKLTIFPKHFQ